MSYKSSVKRAVFLDRDGTINKEVDNLRSVKQLRLLPGVTEAIKKLNKLGCLVVVVTNQPVVARGLATEGEVDEIHAVLLKRLAKKGARIDAIYYCPHHPEASIKRYRLSCRCRKPNIGMLLKAIKKFKISPKDSFIIGDRTADILTGKRAGLRTILLKTGYAGQDGKYNIKPDLVVKNISEAVRRIKTYAG
jgi:histidinol-phosphate phosphatase family protein